MEQHNCNPITPSQLFERIGLRPAGKYPSGKPNYGHRGTEILDWCVDNLHVKTIKSGNRRVCLFMNEEQIEDAKKWDQSREKKRRANKTIAAPASDLTSETTLKELAKTNELLDRGCDLLEKILAYVYPQNNNNNNNEEK